MASKTPITEALARELGYKDIKELKKALSERDKGSLKERLESGQGFGEAIRGSFADKTTDIKQTFTKKGAKNLGRRAYREFFSGEDIFSSYMRGRLRKKERKELEEKGINEGPGGESGSGDSGFTRVIAKESMMIPGMARDMNVMRQNIQKLVKLWSGKESKGKPYAQGADEFFMRSDQAESELEASRIKGPKQTTSPTPQKEEEKGGFLDNIMGMFSGGFMNAIKSLFNPKTLMKVFSKVFLPVVIIGTLFSGIMDGFKKYQETGSFSEAIIAGLGGMLSFLTFGLFGEDTLRKLFDSVSNFFAPITDTISEIFTGIKNFFIKLFGGQVQVEDKTPAKMDLVKPSDKGIDASKFAEGAAKSAGEGDQKSKDIGALFGKVQKGDMEGTIKSAQDFSLKYPQPAETTSPTPVASSKEEAKMIEKVDGKKIKLPSGVTTDPNSGLFEYKGIMFGANNQKEFDLTKSAIDEKKIIEYQTNDRNAGRITKIFNGATGEYSNAPPKAQNASPMASAESAGGTNLSSSGGESVSASGGSGSVSASPSSASGESMSSASSQIAEAQRMESAADQGSIVNSPTNNTNSSSQGQGNKKAADAYDSDLASILATT